MSPGRTETVLIRFLRRLFLATSAPFGRGRLALRRGTLLDVVQGQDPLAQAEDAPVLGAFLFRALVWGGPGRVGA